MKKFFIILVLCFVPFLFLTGCKKNELKKAGKNLSNYNLNLTVDWENKTVAGNEEVEYVNSSEQELGFICFNLYPSAFREGSTQSVVSTLNKARCYPNGESFGGIEVLSCTGESVAGFEIGGEDENILKVNLTCPLEKGKSTKIKIDFNLQVPNCNHRFGWGENTMNLGNFYPIACVFENGEFVQNAYHFNGDPFYSECANYTVSVTAPSSLTVAGSGMRKEKQNGESKTTTFSNNAIRDFALVLGEFQTKSTSVDGTNINYYFYNDENADLSLETAKKSIQTFNKLFGTYPYSCYNVVQTGFIQGGMEYPCLVMISDSVSAQDYQNVIVHETAHQWWYGMVGNNQIENAWQDEALAEFSTALFYKYNPEYNIDFEKHFTNLKASYQVFEKVYTEVLKDLDKSMNRSIDEFNTEPEYTYLTYVKGNLMFKALYDSMGEKKFLNALQEYLKEHKFKVATPQNLIDCFSKESGSDMTSFFENWLSGNVNINEL